MPNWTENQRSIVESESTARILVDAGPGTGKTAVACGRIAYLINELGLEPVNIWLVSFTRTAVHELRNRIAGYLNNPAEASAIKIATIDSHAWAIHSGFSQEATLTGSFEENIEKVVSLVQSKEGVFEYLSGVQHLFIDEAQDVVGLRCLLMLEIIHALSPTAGVTVLADEAQSIYGFTEDADTTNGKESVIKETLPDAIRKYREDLNFEERELTEIHRTADLRLCKIFSEGRLAVSRKTGGHDNLIKIRQIVGDTNHGILGSFRDDIVATQNFDDDCFFLFRRRGEALEASSFFNTRSHRLRISGLPAVIEPWLAKIFWDWTQPRIDETSFLDRWTDRIPGYDHEGENKWRVLIRLFGVTEHQLSVEKMAARLGGGSPPIELCSPDFGFAGPVVGTIHGVKGREADEVRLYLPRIQEDSSEGVESGEEARIVFVGATRARKKLKIGAGATRTIIRRAGDGNRAFTDRSYRNEGSASVELGRQGDVDALGLAGKQFFDLDHVEWAQEKMLELEGMITTDVLARLSKSENDFRYGVRLEENLDPVCFLSRQVNSDLFKIADHFGLQKPPYQMKHLRIFGIRSLVLKPDDPVRPILHRPWSDSGFMLAPLLIGYSTIYFR